MSKFVNILKIAGATMLLGLGTTLGVTGGILSWQGVANKDKAYETFAQTQEYIHQREKEDIRMETYTKYFEKKKELYNKGEISTEAFSKAEKEYQDELKYSNYEFFEMAFKKSDNAEIKGLLKTSNLELGFGITLCVLAGVTFISKIFKSVYENVEFGWADDYGNRIIYSTGRYLVYRIGENIKEIKEDSGKKEKPSKGKNTDKTKNEEQKTEVVQSESLPSLDDYYKY